MVLAQAPVLVAADIAALRQRGFEVRYFNKALDALASFGTIMPEVAVLGPVSHTPALRLLIEDLALYGVPVTSPSQSAAERFLQVMH